ncbi:hypothetical protein AwErysi_00180 [Erysipelotrichaceae bacterium]|nr:hypothetical protein AwErysi_00180 [Erysipelotrichaceae bacterium]
MNRFVGRFLISVLVLIGFVAFSFFSSADSASVKVVHTIQKQEPILAGRPSGDLLLSSMVNFYAGAAEASDEELGMDANQGTAFRTLANYIALNVPNVEESSAKKVSGAYIGNSSDSSVTGVYVLTFPRDIQIGQDISDIANTAELEYFIVKDKIMVIADADYLADLDIDFSDFEAKVLAKI